MSIIFNQLVQTTKPETTLETVNTQIDSSAVDFVNEYYNNTSDEFNKILVEAMQGTYLGVKENMYSIVSESICDMCNRVIEWFKKWIVKFVEFVKKWIKKLWDWFTRGKSVAEDYLKEDRYFEPFEVTGYKFTISTTDLPVSIIDRYIDEVIDYAEIIGKADCNNLSTTYANAKEKMIGEAALNRIRGELLGTSLVSSSDFSDSVKKSFRNGSVTKSKIFCDPKRVYAMAHEYNNLEKVLDSCKKNRKDLEYTCDMFTKLIGSEHKYYNKTVVDKRVEDALNGNENLASKKDILISNYFTAVNATIKQIQLIFDKYYSLKIDATKDALKQYMKIICRGYKESKNGGVSK